VVSDGTPIATPALCRALGEALSRPARLFGFPTGALRLIRRLKPLLGDLELNDLPLREQLGWTPPFSLEEGLGATVHWYRGEYRGG
jgi:nucleoside-diphosphate-sugar epimerase